MPILAVPSAMLDQCRYEVCFASGEPNLNVVALNGNQRPWKTVRTPDQCSRLNIALRA